MNRSNQRYKLCLDIVKVLWYVVVLKGDECYGKTQTFG